MAVTTHPGAQVGGHAGGVTHMETTTGLDNRKLGMWIFLASECLFFGSLIATFMSYRNRSLVPPAPHLSPHLINIPFTSISAFELLMSSLTMVLALAAVQRGEIGKARIWLLATAGLGLGFLSGQFFEFNTFYWVDGLSPQINLFGTTFFTLTGFHGAHVTVGVFWLLSLFFLSFRSDFGPAKALNVEIAGLYWHFVDVVWIAIFTLVYLLPPH